MMDATNAFEESIQESKIVKFFEGRSIFITGGTGFLGTVLIEKLLFTCKNIKNVYVLIKPKRGISVEKRLAQMLELSAFQRIKEHHPGAIKKIIPIRGDLVEHNLGMTEKDTRLLENEVSVVFHLAANISLVVNLANAINTNTKSTEMFINICKKMRNLTAFIYVSSGFSQCNKSIVDEVFYDLTVPVEEVYQLLEIPNSEKAIMNLLDGRPNAYTYSKALAEEIIRRNTDQIPVAIVRPTQILSAVREPLPGWIPSWTGPTSIVAAACRGLWYVWHSDPDIIVDVVPVDYVANLTIATAWDTHNRRIKEETKMEAKVFNCSTGLENPLTNGRFISRSLEQNRKVLGIKAMFANRIFFVKKHFFSYWILYIIFQFFFINTISFVIDTMFWLTGRNTRMIKLQKDIEKLASVLRWFTQRQILFLNSNVRRLYECLNETDKKLFNFDVSNIQWDNYLRDYVVGIKKYIIPK